MAIQGTMAAVAAAYGVYSGVKKKHKDEAAEQAHQTAVENARTIAKAEDPYKRADEAAKRARASRDAAMARTGQRGGTLLTQPGAQLGTFGQRKTLLGS